MSIPTCPEDMGWPETNINSTRELPCGVGIVGTQTRFCFANQTWGPVQDGACGGRQRGD